MRGFGGGAAGLPAVCPLPGHPTTPRFRRSRDRSTPARWSEPRPRQRLRRHGHLLPREDDGVDERFILCLAILVGDSHDRQNFRGDPFGRHVDGEVRRRRPVARVAHRSSRGSPARKKPTAESHENRSRQATRHSVAFVTELTWQLVRERNVANDHCPTHRGPTVDGAVILVHSGIDKLVGDRSPGASAASSSHELASSWNCSAVTS